MRIPGLTVVCFLIFLASTTSFAAELTAKHLFDPMHVVQVEIELPKQEWETLRTQSRDFRTAFTNPTSKPYSYFEATAKIDGVEIEKVGLRKKGFIGSQDTERPSLKINFGKFKEQTPIDGITTLTLNNNKQDRSLLSQSLSYNLFRKAGVHAPRCNYAAVTVNGKFLGIYSHVESIKKPYLSNEFGDSSGRLYEGTLSDFYPKAVDRIEAKNKAAIDREPAMQLAELLVADGPLDIPALEKIIDVDNFLKYWAVESIINFWDGYTQNQNNYFAYQNPKDGKFYFMPWGADSCFSRNAGFGRFRRTEKSDVVSADSMLANRLFNTPGIPDRYRKTLERILNEVWDVDEMITESERIFTMLKDEFDVDQLDAYEAINQTQAFIKSRKQEILAELESDWPTRVSSEPRRPMYEVPVGTIRGTFASKWDETTDVAEPAKLEYKGETIESPSQTVRIQNEQQFRFGGFGPPPNPNPPVMIVIAYERPNAPTITLTLRVPAEDFSAAKGKKLAVTGTLSQGGQRRWGGGMGESVKGTLTLAKSSTNRGAPVEGEFAVTISQLRGGFMDRR